MTEINTATKLVPTIGLEIHAELKTKTKMFCDSLNDPDETEPNKNVCPICVGHPGTLPTLNKEAIKHVLKIGHAIDAQIADYTEWDRKNYFYPDIPKGYQISQYKYPLVSGGSINGIEITRIHLEEDTGTSIHDQGDFSLVNFNRAGLPLMELVTEPVIHSAREAADFARELQLLLRYLEVSDANMEKGEMRVEANISVGPANEIEQDGHKILVPQMGESGAPIFGTKVEVKNLNSFKIVGKAIEYEIDRMTRLIEDGKADEIVQETRGWNEATSKTFSQRRKETSDDYRYFPDPDLPKLKISEIPEFEAEKIKAEIGELPWQKREMFLDLGLNQDQAELLTSNLSFGRFFESIKDELKEQGEELKIAANYLTSDIASIYKKTSNILEKVSPKHLIDIVKMISAGDISSRGAKDILAEISGTEDESFARQLKVSEIAESKGLLQQSDEGEIEKIVDQVIAENPEVVEEYQGGKEVSLKFLVGQGMKLSRGSANPQVLEKVLVDKLK